MEIIWYGHSCFRITERGSASVVADPYNASIGYPLPKLRAHIVTVSHNAAGHNNVGLVKGSPRVITGPGEYEIGGVFVIGVPMYKVGSNGNDTRRNIMYLYDFNGLTTLHLGDLDHVPKQSKIEALGEVNVALVPVGGGVGLKSAQAAEVISLLEPNIVIPMHYKTPSNKLSLDPVQKFLKEMGITNPQEQEKLSVGRANLPEQTQIIVLADLH